MTQQEQISSGLISGETQLRENFLTLRTHRLLKIWPLDERRVGVIALPAIGRLSSGDLSHEPGLLTLKLLVSRVTDVSINLDPTVTSETHVETFDENRLESKLLEPTMKNEGANRARSGQIFVEHGLVSPHVLLEGSVDDLGFAPKHCLFFSVPHSKSKNF